MHQKKFLLFLASTLCILPLISLQAQSAFKLDKQKSAYIELANMECIYKYTINTITEKKSQLLQSREKTENTDAEVGKKISEVYNAVLQVGASTSKFWDYNSFQKDSAIYVSPVVMTLDSISKLEWKYNYRLKYIFSPVILKNFPEGKLTVTDEITPNDYIYEEEKTDRNWTLTEDTLTVCGYLCHKATTHFGGNDWIAWYAPDIPVSDGPWKFYGLPGLILRAEDQTKTHCFDAIAIRKSNNPIYLDNNSARIKVKKSTFLKNKNDFEKNYSVDNINMASIKSFSVFKESELLIINGKRMSANKTSKYMPLEIE